MLIQEAELLRKGAEICARMDAAHLKTQSLNLPEPHKSALIHSAWNAAMDASNVFRQLITRWLVGLGR